MQVKLQITGIEDLRNRLGSLGRQVNYAASRALNTAAFAANADIKADMARNIAGGPTAYTLRAFQIKRADKTRLTAEVALRTDAPGGAGTGSGTRYDRALGHLFTGGRRSFKHLEGYLRAQRLIPDGLAVSPGPGAALDRYGNQRRAQLTEMLGALKSTARTGGATASGSGTRIYRKTGAKAPQKAVVYFVAAPGNPQRLPPGIYRRTETGTRSAIAAVLLYVRPGSYRRQIDLAPIAQRAAATFRVAFDADLDRAIANARP